MEALEALAPVLLRGFDSHIEGYPHVLVEHLEGPTLRRLIKQERRAARRADAAARAARGLGHPLHGGGGLVHWT